MTTLVVTKAGGEDEKNRVTLQLLLLDKYLKADEEPKLGDERVVVREEGKREYGVVKFEGVATEVVVKEKVEKLKKSLERERYRVSSHWQGITHLGLCLHSGPMRL